MRSTFIKVQILELDTYKTMKEKKYFIIFFVADFLTDSTELINVMITFEIIVFQSGGVNAKTWKKITKNVPSKKDIFSLCDVGKKFYFTSIILCDANLSSVLNHEMNTPDETAVPFSSHPSQTTD